MTDSLGTSYTEVTSVCNSVITLSCAGIAYGTTTTNGSSDALTVSFGSPTIQNDVFVYDLTGVTTTGATTGTGEGDFSPISTASTAFPSGSFLVGVTDLVLPGTFFTAGTGFTVSSQNSGDQVGYSQYSLSGVASPTNFPATTDGDDWVEAGLALPIPASFGPSIVYGNVTWSGVAYQGLQYIFPASVAINGRQFSSTFL